MTDPDRRRAARLATLVAVPVALLVGLVSFQVLDSRNPDATPVAVQSLSTGSTSTVTMAAPTLSARHATMCLAFIAALPFTLNKLTQRHVSAGQEQNVAYGDPPITAACGVAPAVVPADGEAYTLSQVCWYVQTRADATVWTTLDREVPVAVTVPAGYSSPGQWVTSFSDALVDSVPSVPTKYNCG